MFEVSVVVVVVFVVGVVFDVVVSEISKILESDSRPPPTSRYSKGGETKDSDKDSHPKGL